MFKVITPLNRTKNKFTPELIQHTISPIIIALLIRGVFPQDGRHPSTALYVLITTGAVFQTIL